MGNAWVGFIHKAAVRIQTPHIHIQVTNKMMIVPFILNNQTKKEKKIGQSNHTKLLIFQTHRLRKGEVLNIFCDVTQYIQSDILSLQYCKQPDVMLRTAYLVNILQSFNFQE